jgi:hypothetical protein
MKEKVNIMCIYWTGDFRGRDFSPLDVHRLYQTVNKHIDRSFNFYCLTNDMNCDVPGTKIALKHPDDWPGWWAKMELHRPDLPSGRTLYMDLDSHAIRSLQPILDTRGDLVMFNARMEKNTPGVVCRYQAATMLFDPGKFSWIYDKFMQDWAYYINHYRSDQDILGEWVPDQPAFQDEWLIKMSRLVKNREYWNHPPKKVIIVTGQPKQGWFRRTREIPWFEKMARG